MIVELDPTETAKKTSTLDQLPGFHNLPLAEEHAYAGT